ncbi:pilus assembly protein PilM [Bacillus shivajii]|uniref:type IV pilus biogenesis protein PilM n=1 Tax=Bacillus shivajii TaxID=1983719 RepID=UPI001CFBBB33|nr:pilus assembly protein PilM [Bacillus shivajii]UCZ52095.1 pilus assembly protein PilM [Bacillus shivajii]
MFQRKKQIRNCLMIQDHVIRCVRAKRPQLDAITEFYERYLPPGIIENGNIKELETFMTILEECVDDWKLKRQNVFFTIPDSAVVLRRHQIPDTVKEDELKGHLYFELGEKLHLPFENPLMDLYDLGVQGKMREVLIFASPEETVLQFSQLLEEVKLKPLVADLAPLSYFRLYFEEDLVERDEHMMLIQCYPTQVNVTIFHEDAPLIMRSLTWEHVNDSWQLSEEEGKTSYIWDGDEDEVFVAWQNMMNDIEKLANFYRFSYQKGEVGVNKVTLTGDHPFLSTFEQEMEERLDLPVKVIENPQWVTTEQEQIPLRFYEGAGLVLKKEV